MKQSNVYITDMTWFENTANKNPLSVLDHNLEGIYPQFYRAEYDLKLLATKPATKQEKELFCYDDYREKYGHTDISVLERAVSESEAKNAFFDWL